MGLKQFLKRAGYRIAPQVTTAVVSSRARAHSTARLEEWGLFDLNRKLLERSGRRVLAGPFQGLVLGASAPCQHIGPYVLGTYEMELHRWLADCALRRFEQIVNVGSSVGYYAVGLARQFPQAPVVAFDPDWWARRAVAEMAAANGVANLTVERFCTAAWLNRRLRPNALIVSDCEGYERELFCGQAIPALATATLIVELHEATPGELAGRFRERYAGTHAIDEVRSRSTTPPLPQVPGLSDAEVERLSQEVRGLQTWVYLRPLAHDRSDPRANSG